MVGEGGGEDVEDGWSKVGVLTEVIIKRDVCLFFWWWVVGVDWAWWAGVRLRIGLVELILILGPFGIFEICTRTNFVILQKLRVENAIVPKLSQGSKLTT